MILWDYEEFVYFCYWFKYIADNAKEKNHTNAQTKKYDPVMLLFTDCLFNLLGMLWEHVECRICLRWQVSYYCSYLLIVFSLMNKKNRYMKVRT